jgi:hypothetical protein
VTWKTNKVLRDFMPAECYQPELKETEVRRNKNESEGRATDVGLMGPLVGLKGAASATGGQSTKPEDNSQAAKSNKIFSSTL